MGIRERRERERQELRGGILAAARELAAHEGWQAVTIRKVAERVEYSPPMIYEHFANKEAILVELMREGFRLLHETQRKALVGVGGPRAAVRALGLAYCRFAWQHPELYQVMHGLGGVPFCPDPFPKESDHVYREAYHTLQQLQQRAGARIDDLDSAVEVLWASLHGLVALTMTERIDGGHERGEQLALLIINNLLVAWQATGGE